MPRIHPIQVSDTQGQTRQMLESVQHSLGMVPNLLKTLAQSPAALEGYLGFSHALGGALDPALREGIALAVAGLNQCSYCASAHTVLGAAAGVEADELEANLRGHASSEQTDAALRFARAVVDKRGLIDDADLADVRDAGFTDVQIVEVVAVVALNIFTNYLNHVADTEVDFPVVYIPQVTA